jgi:hypothetical protein
MLAGTAMSDQLFPPNHETRLLSTFKYVDDVLTQAVERLESASSPFSEYVADAGPADRRAVAEHLERVRIGMRRFLESHGIEIPAPSTSALWAASTACVYAGVSVEELRGRYMKAYGAISPAADAELDRIVTQLTEVINQMNAALVEIKNAAIKTAPPSLPATGRDTAE